jgi:hypothetical protein
VSNDYDEKFLRDFEGAQSLAQGGAGSKLRQGSTDRHERFARGFAAAEVDDKQHADDADVELHERSSVVLIAVEGGSVGIELLNDSLESRAQP